MKCDDTNKKNNEKCMSDAKFMVKFNKETDYIHPKCGRHCRKIHENDKIPIINEKNQKPRNSKYRETDFENNEEINNIDMKVKDKYEHINKTNKYDKLFEKIDELCDLLNKTDIDNK